MQDSSSENKMNKNLEVVTQNEFSNLNLLYLVTSVFIFTV